MNHEINKLIRLRQEADREVLREASLIFGGLYKPHNMDPGIQRAANYALIAGRLNAMINVAVKTERDRKRRADRTTDILGSSARNPSPENPDDD